LKRPFGLLRGIFMTELLSKPEQREQAWLAGEAIGRLVDL
jgi:hypothetical protein